MHFSRLLIGCLAAAALSSADVHGLILADKSPAHKHRKDIGKQLRKYGFCLAKAALVCEKKGTTSAYECTLETGVAGGGVEPKAALKFAEKVAKCAAKFDPSKKEQGSSYDLIGCPTDCDDGAPGLQRCTDLNDYESEIEDGSQPESVHAAWAAIAAEVDSNCGLFLGESIGSSSDVMLDCVGNDWNQLVKYFKGASLCANLCEADFKDKKGFGGLTDDPVCEVEGAGSAFAFDICVGKKAVKHLAKIDAPGNASSAKALVEDLVNGITLDLYDKKDPTAVSIVPVCSTCGDNLRQGIEECDGTSAIFCGTGCNPDCTCF